MGEIEAEGDIYMEFGQEGKTQGLIQGSLSQPPILVISREGEEAKRPEGKKRWIRDEIPVPTPIQFLPWPQSLIPILTPV